MLEEYLTRLVAINETKKILVTKDIFNKENNIIAGKGDEVNQVFRDHITKSSFRGGLESYITIDNELDGIELFKRIQTYLADSFPDKWPE